MIRAALRRLARWLIAQADEPETPGAPLPDDWPTVWPERANRHYWARGWGNYTVECPRCAQEYQAVAAVGTSCAAVCPYCGMEWEMKWTGAGDEPPNDGVWL